MKSKTLNIIIWIVLAFVVVFFAGSFAYEQYKMEQDDQRYEESIEQELDNTAKDNQSNPTAGESRN